MVPPALSKYTSYAPALAADGQLNVAALPSLHVALPLAGEVYAPLHAGAASAEMHTVNVPVAPKSVFDEIRTR